MSPEDREGGAELLRGPYEPAGTALFEEVVDPGMTVVDVGANLGVYTVLGARATGPTGRVVSFEPDPATCALLGDTVALNGFGNVDVVAKAVAADEGRATFYRFEGHSGIGSLCKPNARGGTETIDVETTTLDGELDRLGVEHVDVVKLDVQGAEIEVLRGAASVLARDHPRLFVEFWPHAFENMGVDPWELPTLIRDAGYSIRTVDAPEREIADAEIAACIEEVGVVDFYAVAQ